MKFENPTETVIYSIEQTIKAYRKIAQKNITEKVKDITLDQCLILIILNDNSTLSQKEIANLIFKDYASMTRIIESMIKKGYLTKKSNEKDRRKFDLKITNKGQQTIALLIPVVKKNREMALHGLTLIEINQLYSSLQKIISNCKNT